jgi:hypothetical protein
LGDEVVNLGDEVAILGISVRSDHKAGLVPGGTDLGDLLQDACLTCCLGRDHLALFEVSVDSTLQKEVEG